MNGLKKYNVCVSSVQGSGSNALVKGGNIKHHCEIKHDNQLKTNVLFIALS